MISHKTCISWALLYLEGKAVLRSQLGGVAGGGAATAGAALARQATAGRFFATHRGGDRELEGLGVVGVIFYISLVAGSAYRIG